MLLPKDLAIRIGGFDERFFMYAEDTDICEKVRREGREIYYLSEAHIIHFGGASTPLNSPFSVVMMRESTEQYIDKYYGIASVFLCRLIVIVGSIARLLLLFGGFWGSVYGSSEMKKRRKSSIMKYILMIQWVLGLKKPAPPT
jgi:GT2 family glycosyltransferase